MSSRRRRNQGQRSYRHQKHRRLPKLPGTADRGAPLPAPSDLRYEMVKVGEQANGWPIVEARLKSWPGQAT